jgi:D-glycero-beta-D-manno-heptose 1-phosphate adenylyltransferase
LIVAVNDDKSMRMIKGEGHPLMPEGERMEILAALRCVDYITLFSEKTVDSLLLKLKPHVHAKGTDYTVETVPERETVLSYGGEIAITGDQKNHSSSEIKNAL